MPKFADGHVTGVRGRLDQLDTDITSKLLERSQYRANPAIYRPGGVEIVGGFEGSFLELYLSRQERFVEWPMGRFQDKREHPFGPKPSRVKVLVRREQQEDPAVVMVNRNEEIRRMYERAVPLFCKPGDDGQYGSAARVDIVVLQDISKRVGMGELVAESKLETARDVLAPLIIACDWAAVREALRDVGREQDVVERVMTKAQRQGNDPDLAARVGVFYRDQIIPLTIDVEIEYLRRRIGEEIGVRRP